MGLIKAALGAAGGVLADQWKEYFYCESLPADVLVEKGQKRKGNRSSNTKGSDNIITNGSIFVVADGQCALIVDQGMVVDVCAEPGEYTYDASTEPSIFSGNLGESIKESFKVVGKRFTFGGEAPKDQRIYYFNTKEIMGNKYGTASPVPFRVVDERAAIDIDISAKCFGEYSYKIVNPLLFYKNICSNITDTYKRSNLESQLRSELLTALQPAFGKISAMGIRYSAVVSHTTELRDALKEELSAKWRDVRGIEIQEFGVSSIKATEEDEQMIKEMQRNVAFMDPTRAQAHLVGARASAMQAAASNTAGAAVGFMGMGMANNMSAGIEQGLSQQVMMQQQQQFAQQTHQNAAQQAAAGWTCSCGQTGNTGKFCQSCGSPKPEPKAAGSWTCKCGATVTGKFCTECGSKKPEEAEGWTCSCGAVNKGKFCPECGAKKPAGVPQYKCDKCGWEPPKGANPPRFCQECGDPFDNDDII